MGADRDATLAVMEMAAEITAAIIRADKAIDTHGRGYASAALAVYDQLHGHLIYRYENTQKR
jgi:hypothetical protein